MLPCCVCTYVNFLCVFTATAENLQEPKLKKSLEDKTVIRGEKAILEAVFTGNPAPEAKW